MADVAIDAALVRALLRQQHPDLAELPLTAVDGGWDNRLFRLGGQWLVRLPCRQPSAGLVAHEHKWLAELAPHLPLPVPVPARTGCPGAGFPWSWSVVPWFDGEHLAHAMPEDPVPIAGELAGFLRALHRPAPADAPANPWRGVPLAARAVLLESQLHLLSAPADHEAALDVWRQALSAATPEGAPVWIHGDLHPRNLLTSGGRLAAVLDFGDLTAGDPAVDFAIAWMLPAAFREAFRAALADGPHPVDDAAWQRARGWALALGLAFVNGSREGDPMAALGGNTIDAVLHQA